MKTNIVKNNDLVSDLRGQYNNICNGSIINNRNINGIFVSGTENLLKNMTISKLKGISLIFNITQHDPYNNTDYIGNIFTNGTINDNGKGILILSGNHAVNSSTIIGYITIELD